VVIDCTVERTLSGEMLTGSSESPSTSETQPATLPASARARAKRTMPPDISCGVPREPRDDLRSWRAGLREASVVAHD
jgi:hypothetical protein